MDLQGVNLKGVDLQGVDLGLEDLARLRHVAVLRALPTALGELLALTLALDSATTEHRELLDPRRQHCLTVSTAALRATGVGREGVPRVKVAVLWGATVGW